MGGGNGEEFENTKAGGRRLRHPAAERTGSRIFSPPPRGSSGRCRSRRRCRLGGSPCPRRRCRGGRAPQRPCGPAAYEVETGFFLDPRTGKREAQRGRARESRKQAGGGTGTSARGEGRLDGRHFLGRRVGSAKLDSGHWSLALWPDTQHVRKYSGSSSADCPSSACNFYAISA